MRVRPFKRWFIIALILVLVGTFIYLFLPFLIDEDEYRRTVEASLSFALGRSVSLQGPITLNLSLHPTLVLEDVRIANPSWASHPFFLQATRLEAQLAILPLINRRFVVDKLFFDGVNLHLEEGPNELNNWTFGKDSKPAPPSETASDPYVTITEEGFAALQRVTISYQPYSENSSEDPTQLTIIEGTILLFENRFRKYSFRGTFREIPFTLELTGGRFVDLFNLTGPWPIDGVLVAAETTLRAKGQLNKSDTDPYLEFTGSLSGEDLSSLNPLLKTDMPDYGPYELITSLSLSKTRLSLKDSRLKVGQTDLAGLFIMDFKEDRTHYSSRLTGDILQTNDFQSSEPENNPASTSPPFSEPFAKQIGMADIDIDLELAINNFLVDTQNLGKIALSAKLEEGFLSVTPFRAETYGGVLSGSLELDGNHSAPRVSGELTVQDWDYGQALKDLGVTSQISGSTNLEASIRGQGATLQAFLEETDFSIKAGPSSLTIQSADEDDPLLIEIALAKVQAMKGGAVKAWVKGDLNQKAIDIGIETGTLTRLGTTSKSWPISLFARSGDVSVTVKGGVKPEPQGLKVALGVTLKGKQLSHLDPELPASGPYGLSGWLFKEGEQYRVTDLKARLGRTDINGALSMNLEGETPQVSGAFSSQLVSVEDLSTPGDITIPVDAFRALNATLNWDIKRLQAETFELGDLALQGNLTEGRLVVTSLEGKLLDKKFAYAQFQGELELDVSTTLPTFSGTASIKNMDYAQVIKQLGIDAQMVGMGNLEASFSSQGKTIFTMLAQPTFKIEEKHLQMTSPDENKKSEIVMSVEHAFLSSTAGGPITFTAEGSFQNTPFSITSSSGAIKNLFTDITQWPLAISVNLPKVLIDVSGHINFPLNGEDFHFNVSLKGETLAELNFLWNGTPPDLGPIKLKGVLTQIQEGYTLTDFKTQLGPTDVGGHLSLITTGRRPKLVGKFTTEISEFGFLTRTITESMDSTDKPILKNIVTSVAKIGTKAAKSVTDIGMEAGKKVTKSLGMKEEASEGPHDRVLPDFEFPVDAMRSIDLEIDWQINEVQSKGWKLGKFAYTLALKNGRLTIDPVKGTLWDGVINGKIELDASLYVPTLAIDLTIQGLDYGFLDTSVGLQDLIRGESELISLNVKGRGTTLREVLSRANGTAEIVDGAIVITNEYIDLWAADIFRIALSKAWEKEDVTKLNCLVGRFDIVDGEIQSDAILFDTDRITVGGFGTLDLDTEKIDLILTPQPKNPTLVTLGTPVRISGYLSDPDVTSNKLRIAQGGAWYLLGLINPIGLVVVIPKIAGTTLGTGKKNPCAVAMLGKEFTVQEVSELQEGFWDWMVRKMKGAFHDNDDSINTPPKNESRAQ